MRNFHDIDNYPTLTNALFGTVKLTKNSDIDKFWHSYPFGRTGRNVIIFAVDMSSSTKIDNNGKDILILGLGPTFGLGENLFVFD